MWISIWGVSSLKGKTHACTVERAILLGQVSKAPVTCLQLPYPVNVQSHRQFHTVLCLIFNNWTTFLWRNIIVSVLHRQSLKWVSSMASTESWRQDSCIFWRGAFDAYVPISQGLPSALCVFAGWSYVTTGSCDATERWRSSRWLSHSPEVLFAFETLTDCMICMNMSTRMLDLAPLYRLCPGVASENQITLSSWRRHIMPFYTFQVRFYRTVFEYIWMYLIPISLPGGWHWEGQNGDDSSGIEPGGR